MRAGRRGDQAGLVGDDDQLDPVPGAELGQQPGHVRLGGGGADDQAAGDLAVGQAAADEGQHLALPVGDAGRARAAAGPAGAAAPAWPGELLDEPAGDAGRDQRVAGRDHADRGQDVLQRHVLDQEAARAGAQRGVHVVVVVERGQHDDPGRPGPGASAA